MEKQGIKEVSEFLDGLKIVIPELLEIQKDGLGLDDIDNIVNLLTKADVLQEAVKDLDKAKEELKDLDKEEALLLVGKIMDVVELVKAKA
jgi:hypothetical protein